MQISKWLGGYINIFEYNEYRNIVLGLCIFLYLSFLRGFVSIGVSYLINVIPDNIAVLIAISPVFFLFVPNKYYKIWINSSPIVIVIWIFSVFISILPLKLLFVFIGIALTFGLMRFIILINFEEDSGYNLINAIIWGILIDLGIRATNQGTEVLVSTNVLTRITCILLSILLFILLFSYRGPLIDLFDDLIVLNAEEPSIRSIIGRNLSTMGLFLNFGIYFIFFANPGILTLTYDLTSNIASFLHVSVSSIMLILTYFAWQKLRKYDLVIDLISIIMLIFSILFFPWYHFWVIFWVMGLFSNFYLMFSAMHGADYLNTTHRFGIAGSIVLGVIINIVIIFLMIQLESFYLQLSQIIIASIVTFTGYLLLLDEDSFFYQYVWGVLNE